MTKDLEIIMQLEKEIGYKLQKLSKKWYKNHNSNVYCIDKNDNVILLYLDRGNFKSFPITILELKNLTQHME